MRQIGRPTLAAFALLTHFASAQTPNWSTVFTPRGVLGGGVLDAVVYDDGSGDALFVAGWITAAGDTAGQTIGKWQNGAWRPFASAAQHFSTSFTAHVEQLEVLDTGSGPELYAGGAFNSIEGVPTGSIARWRNGTWSILGASSPTNSTDTITLLKALDEGSTKVLYVGHAYGPIGGLPQTSFARWDGSSWSLVGQVISGAVKDAEVFDDGTGPKLYVCGHLFIGGGPYKSVAVYDGSSWASLGSAAPGSSVDELAVFDDGTGPALYAGGSFSTIGGVHALRLAKWGGTTWSEVGGGIDGGFFCEVRSLAVHDDGSGAALYVGGNFDDAGGNPMRHLARWDGAAWSSVGAPTGGVLLVNTQLNTYVNSMIEFDDGAGTELAVAGVFSRAGDRTALNVARWDGANWGTFGDGHGVDSSPRAFESFAGALYVGGSMTAAGGADVKYLATWDGTQWTATPGDLDQYVAALVEHDDGSGPALFAAGGFVEAGGQTVDHVARFDGAQWSPLGIGVTSSWPTMHALTTFDEGAGTQLFVSGSFQTIGNLGIEAVARWDGAAWSGLGVGVLPSVVYALRVHDDSQGGGPELYGAGIFAHIAGDPSYGVARWDGQIWRRVGQGFSDVPYALAVFDDGSGAKLFAAGAFTVASPVSAQRVAYWDGTQWRAAGAGFNGRVNALEVFDDGTGAALYAGGKFTASGPTPMRNFARWNGTSWSEAGGGADAEVSRLAVADDGLGEALYLGGLFVRVGSVVSPYIARYGKVCGAQAYCTIGVTSHGCSPAISGVGTPSASAAPGFTIQVATVEGGTSGIVFYGVSGTAATPWGPSGQFLCIAPPLQRTPLQSTGGTQGACNGSLALDWSAYVASNPLTLGAPFSAGQRLWAQGYFRDSASAKTTALSNALAVILCP